VGGARVRSSIGEEIATFRRSGLSEAGSGSTSNSRLHREKPADVPVQLSTKVELIKPATNALGLTVPLSLLGRADEVIE